MSKPQPYSFSFFDTVGAELAGVTHYSLHEDPEAMVKASDAMAPLCARLGVTLERSIDVQVTRLRRKIEEDPKLPLYLQTVRGVGYVLVPDRNG